MPISHSLFPEGYENHGLARNTPQRQWLDLQSCWLPGRLQLSIDGWFHSLTAESSGKTFAQAG